VRRSTLRDEPVGARGVQHPAEVRVQAQSRSQALGSASHEASSQSSKASASSRSTQTKSSRGCIVFGLNWISGMKVCPRQLTLRMARCLTQRAMTDTGWSWCGRINAAS
jgi:hypothetical protein